MLLASTSLVALALSLTAFAAAAADPCTVIGGKTWVLPSQVRACFQAQKLNATEKNNVSLYSLSIYARLPAKNMNLAFSR